MFTIPRINEPDPEQTPVPKSLNSLCGLTACSISQQPHLIFILRVMPGVMEQWARGVEGKAGGAMHLLSVTDSAGYESMLRWPRRSRFVLKSSEKKHPNQSFTVSFI